jgi:CBS domain containing-hemolysin-like protein
VNVLLFLHMLLYVSATVLVTRAFLDFVSGPVWWQLVASALGMVVVGYVALGVAPRTLGVQHAERIAIRTAGPARALALLLGPLTQLLILVGNAITPGKGYREGPFASQAELRELVDLAEASDVIEDDERQMIHSVFELGDTVARELMVPRTDMVFVESTKTLRQAISLALRSGFSRIPVTGENLDDVVGVVYLKDMVRRTFEHHEAEQSERVASLMRPVFMVPDSKRADDLLRDMQSARTHLAIVVDEYGGTAGIVTIEDVVEEIVGEITDEYDTEAPEVEALAHGSYRVHSRMHVEDFADLVGIHIKADEESVDTVGGLLAKRLGHVPIPGARITVQGWDLTAESAAGRRNRIGTVLAEPVVPVDDDASAVQEEKTDA